MQPLLIHGIWHWKQVKRAHEANVLNLPGKLRWVWWQRRNCRYYSYITSRSHWPDSVLNISKMRRWTAGGGSNGLRSTLAYLQANVRCEIFRSDEQLSSSQTLLSAIHAVQNESFVRRTGQKKTIWVHQCVVLGCLGWRDADYQSQLFGGDVDATLCPCETTIGATPKVTSTR
jgi:hypothetical protein